MVNCTETKFDFFSQSSHPLLTELYTCLVFYLILTPWCYSPWRALTSLMTLPHYLLSFTLFFQHLTPIFRRSDITSSDNHTLLLPRVVPYIILFTDLYSSIPSTFPSSLHFLTSVISMNRYIFMNSAFNSSFIAILQLPSLYMAS